MLRRNVGAVSARHVGRIAPATMRTSSDAVQARTHGERPKQAIRNPGPPAQAEAGRRFRTHVRPISTGRYSVRRYPRSLRRRAGMHQHSSGRPRSNRKPRHSTIHHVSGCSPAQRAWLGSGTSCQSPLGRPARDAGLVISSLARRLRDIVPAPMRNWDQTQSMQPAAPIPARHWMQAVPTLPMQTAPHATSAAAQAAALKILQPDGLMALVTPCVETPRVTAVAWLGSLMVVSPWVAEVKADWMDRKGRLPVHWPQFAAQRLSQAARHGTESFWHPRKHSTQPSFDAPTPMRIWSVATPRRICDACTGNLPAGRAGAAARAARVRFEDLAAITPSASRSGPGRPSPE